MPSYSCRAEISGSIRLDRYVAERIGLLTRSQIKSRLLEARLNGRPVKLSRLVKAGDMLELSWTDPPPADLIPENIPLDIVYEDERVAVINKPQGMVVHPGAGNYRGTLANALLYRRLERAVPVGTGEWFRPGIVHRLDKDTSGLIIAAYDDEALVFLSDQFRARRVKKTYAALVRGSLREERGRIETGIIRDNRDRKRFTWSPPESGRGKYALSFYRVVRSWGNYSLVFLRPRTGRTHQLRVHLRYLGHPILGDPLYGSPEGGFPGASLMLHAKGLSLTLPGGGSGNFKSPLPRRFRELIRGLSG
ncbi:MAG: RluA family pseudouridine synthase [Treponema sp.]|jgi:23S rRNA pseudouridine1911/1915/1917 synthase|nr:RluA family pseudouridine synthase [Treponema sp.]